MKRVYEAGMTTRPGPGGVPGRRLVTAAPQRVGSACRPGLRCRDAWRIRPLPEWRGGLPPGRSPSGRGSCARVAAEAKQLGQRHPKPLSTRWVDEPRTHETAPCSGRGRGQEQGAECARGRVRIILESAPLSRVWGGGFAVRPQPGCGFRGPDDASTQPAHIPLPQTPRGPSGGTGSDPRRWSGSPPGDI